MPDFGPESLASRGIVGLWNADFLSEAAAALDQPALAGLAAQYDALGRAWSGLADAALPDDVPLLHEAKALLTSKAALLHAGGPSEEVRATWARLAELGQAAGERFPLSADDYRALRVQLRDRIAALHTGEVEAHNALGRLLG